MNINEENHIISNINYATPITCKPPHKRDTEKYDYFRLVSWNVNMQALSAYTPHNWTQNHNKWDLVYQQVMQQNPDIITYQEISIPFYGDRSIEQNYVHPLIQKYIDSKNWYITNSKRSHCGHTLILINKKIESERGYNVCYDDDKVWPVVILKKKDTKLMLFGVHLMYSDRCSQQRRKSFDRLYDLSVKANMNHNLVIIGDTNMRSYDETNILNDYKGQISSCWSLLGDMKNKKNFMMTFYRNFFEIGKSGATRYDKVFTGNKIKCLSIAIFDKAVSKHHFHFLSDHRGICVDIEIQ